MQEGEGKLLAVVRGIEMVENGQRSAAAKTYVIPHNPLKEFAYNIHPSWVLRPQHLI